jgi:hypothetical protein
MKMNKLYFIFKCRMIYHLHINHLLKSAQKVNAQNFL